MGSLTDHSQSLALFREVFYSSPSLMSISVLTDGRLIEVNESFCRILGYSREALLGRTSIELGLYANDVDRTVFTEMLQQDGRVSGLEICVCARSGEKKMLLVGGALMDWDGKACLLVSAEDITERKQAEVSLERRIGVLTQPLDDVETITFEALLDLDDVQRLQDEFAYATGVASIITQVDGTPITNPSNFCRLCNDIIRKTEKGCANCYKSDAVLGRFHPGGPVIQPCLSGGLWDAGAAISVGGKHIANWLIGQVRDETQTEEKMRAYARTIGADEDDVAKAFREVPSMSQQQFERVAQALYTLADLLSTTAYQNVQQSRFIAEREQAEKTLQEYQQLLEDRVETRTAELQAANKELEAFAYSVSHDLRAPLRAIDGYTKFLMEDYVDNLDEEANKLGASIRRNAQRMSQLIDDLLTFSRMGRTALHLTMIDMKHMATSVFQELTTKEERERIRFEVADLPCIKGDEIMIRQVWINLISNAVKFTSHRDQPEIRISFSEEEGAVSYCIEDNGIGFDMEYQDKLFVVFERLHSDKDFRGTGVGLAFVHRIIDRHGGRIWAKGKVDEGAIFCFSLAS